MLHVCLEQRVQVYSNNLIINYNNSLCFAVLNYSNVQMKTIDFNHNIDYK